MFKMMKKSILKIELSIILKIISTCTKCPVLQNGVHVDEILIFKKFQLRGALKDTYVLSNYESYNRNISKILMK
jgi:hypothetical protein